MNKMSIKAQNVVLRMITLLLVVLLCSAAAPKVQIYSRSPGHHGEDNILICHASGFHPPELNIELLKNGKEMDAKQTDLAFEENWYYHLTKHAPFRPNKGEEYACKVTHLGIEKTYHWGKASVRVQLHSCRDPASDVSTQHDYNKSIIIIKEQKDLTSVTLSLY